MSEITDEGRKIALDKYGVRLIPTGVRSHLLGASIPFGPFQVGDYVSISINEDSYVNTGGSATIASNENVLLPSGIHDFVIATGATYIALYSTVADAVGAVWSS